MTRTEAAERLYEAAKKARLHAGRLTDFLFPRADYRALENALDAYSTATPDALPAEVARVVEAVARWHYAPEGGPALAAHCEMRDAIKAYCERVQFTQPDPLPARLARLRPGSVVRLGCSNTPWTVLGNDNASSLWVKCPAGGWMVTVYGAVAAILSESP